MPKVEFLKSLRSQSGIGIFESGFHFYSCVSSAIESSVEILDFMRSPSKWAVLLKNVLVLGTSVHLPDFKGSGSGTHPMRLLVLVKNNYNAVSQSFKRISCCHRNALVYV